MTLRVVKNDVAGWDVMREDEEDALSNHSTREEAEEAARIRAHEDRVSQEGDEQVEVDTEHTHGIDDARAGVKPAFFSMGGLLLLIALIATIAAVIAALTDFGA